jgi:drug/metabolite transporter (DMT)-like permease
MRGAHLLGVASAAMGATLWGLSGVAAQALFRGGVSPAWLTAMRLLVTGICLVVVVRQLLPARAWPRLAATAAGVAAAQYFFFAAVNASDVATASFVQFLAVPILAVYEKVADKAPLTWSRVVTVILALAGVGLLAFGGGGISSFSAVGLLLGLLCAASIAFYTVSSLPLIREYGVFRINGWASLLGSVPLLVITAPWHVQFRGSGWQLAWLLGFVILIGTLAATSLYFGSLRSITPTEAQTATTAEAIAAAIGAALFLELLLDVVQYLGGALIIVAVFLLCLKDRARARDRPEVAAAIGE